MVDRKEVQLGWEINVSLAEGLFLQSQTHALGIIRPKTKVNTVQDEVAIPTNDIQGRSFISLSYQSVMKPISEVLARMVILPPNRT